MSVLDRLRGGLIVSVQAGADSLLNTPETIALLARVAEANGAVGVRIEGAHRIAAVKAAVRIPVIGIIKRAYDGFAPYITVTEREIDEAAAAGADIIAFDATDRIRPTGLSVATAARAIVARGTFAMADCADASDGARAAAAGASIVATTLCGYTESTEGQSLPALELVRALAKTGVFTICEGGISVPSEASAAREAGAAAIVVGTAITNIDMLVQRFAKAAST